MSTQTDAVTGAGNDGEAALPDGLAEQLLAAAKAQGVALSGPGGLLTGLTRQVLQTALDAELTSLFGDEHGGTPAGENVRNGSLTQDRAHGDRPRACEDAPSPGRNVRAGAG